MFQNLIQVHAQSFPLGFLFCVTRDLIDVPRVTFAAKCVKLAISMEGVENLLHAISSDSPTDTVLAKTLSKL